MNEIFPFLVALTFSLLRGVCAMRFRVVAFSYVTVLLVCSRSSAAYCSSALALALRSTRASASSMSESLVQSQSPTLFSVTYDWVSSHKATWSERLPAIQRFKESDRQPNCTPIFRAQVVELYFAMGDAQREGHLRARISGPRRCHNQKFLKEVCLIFTTEFGPISRLMALSYLPSTLPSTLRVSFVSS